jgi:hypothetical protein
MTEKESSQYIDNLIYFCHNGIFPDQIKKTLTQEIRFIILIELDNLIFSYNH